MKNDVNPQRPSQYYPAFLESLPSMQGKTVVITGCSRGLGYVTAKTIVKLGGFVVMMNRKSETANQVLQELTNECSVDSSDATRRVPPALVECDLLSFDSVRQACEQVRKLTKETGIDVLCCNAGVMLQPNQASQDGYDITASTNVLSHFLIVKLLFPHLQQAAAKENNGEARIVSMSSASGYGYPALDPSFFEQRGGKMGGGGQAKYERYHQSKLANLLFTSALDDKLKDTNVKAVACTPGVCGTDMFVHATTVMSGKPASRSNVPSTEDGAMAQLKCICDPTVSSGDLWGPEMGTSTLSKTALAPPQILIDATSKKRLWDMCEKATREVFDC
jgi:NAD(P)-dependent dehydrogenase (short-subunit alcohol dehydrogenase family)